MAASRLHEEKAGLDTIRPGRTLFVRQGRVGSANEDDDSPVSLQLVFVHGLGGTERQFHSLLASLSQQLSSSRVTCVLYDLVGCGQSPCISNHEAYHNKESAADLKELINKYTRTEIPLIFVGHSYGPTIITAYLKEFEAPANLKGLVFLGAAARTPSLALPDGGLTLMQLPVWVLNCLQSSMTASFVQAAVHPSHTKAREFIHEISQANNMFVIQSYHRHTKFACPQDLLVLFKNTPVLVVHGLEDGIIHIQAGQELANVCAAKVVAIEKASHSVMLEQPDEVATAIMNHLITSNVLL